MLKPLRLRLDTVENAAGALENRGALAQRVTGPEQSVEELARVVLHRQHLVGRPKRVPSDVQIGLRRELEARERGVLPNLARSDLIDRHSRVRSVAYLDTFQPGLFGRFVDAAGFVFLAAIAQPGNNRHPIAEWLERLQHLRNLEVSPLACRRP